MADQKSNTYSLDPEIAASLRKPRIDYPGGMVPRRVIAATIIHPSAGLTLEAYPELAGDMPMDALLRLLDQHCSQVVTQGRR